MPLADPVGPQGYWESDTDPIFKTLANDQRAIEAIADALPERFTTKEPLPVADPELHARCIQIGEAENVIAGWDMSWLEDLCGIDLDQLYKQLIGSCVATSHITLVATRTLHEVALLGQPEELLGRKLGGANTRDTICPYGPYSYRAGRKLAGINGMGDGSTCSGQIKGSMAYGFLPCDTPTLSSDYFPEPKSNRAYKNWGANDSKLEQFRDEGQKLDLLESAPVHDVETALDLLEAFKPLQICSGWGFQATNKRLPNGDVLYSRRGSWSHSMQVQAIVQMTDSNWYVKIRNQWGMTHSGKNYFWVSIEEFERWLRSSNTMSIGEIKLRAADSVQFEAT